MQDPHEQLIETICTQVLPNMVRIHESGRMTGGVDQDQIVKIIEQKIERANKSLRMLPVAQQPGFRAMIDRAYAENIDRVRERMPLLQPVALPPAHPEHHSS